MFIELTDHLRCPAAHAEAFVVLLPERVDGRRVLAGSLGCPVCHWAVEWNDGVPDFGGAAPAAGTPSFAAEAAVAMLGIDGPGGWIATSGNAGLLAHALSDVLAGVHVVAVNPPPSVASTGGVSVIRSGRWPLKGGSMRGVVVGSDTPDRDDAVRSVLPGLRACGTGRVPAAVDVMARGGDAWVVKAS